MKTGVEVFLQGLRDLGYEPVTLPGKPDHVVVEYEIHSGKFAGTKLKHGFIVPADFPVTSPSGIHIAALIHPNKSGGDHPTGGVHSDQAAPFQQAIGGQWQYWSRPVAGWGTGKRTVGLYMSHVWCLWDSQ